jgi:hypothetical protein
MKARSLLAAGVALAAMASPAFAHHSGAMFDRTKQVELVGVVKAFQWTNPHSWLQVEAPDGANTAEWSIECGSPNTLARGGWRPTSFKPGDRVTVRINPMRDGAKGGVFVGASLADGKTLGKMDPLAVQNP